MPALRHESVRTNGIQLHCAIAGDGPPLVLLHGFPDGWATWRRQLEPLSKRFTVVAPDLRGYGASDRPEGIAAYGMRQLVDDIAGAIDTLGWKKAHVAGHDWGGAIAWSLAMGRPDRVDRLAILNAPHPVIFRRQLKGWAQLRRSWYVFFFLLPWLPEAGLGANGCRRLRAVIRTSFADRKNLPEAELEAWIEPFQQPGALQAALNYYRAAARPSLGVKPAVIDAPTLLLWGERDTALGRSLTEGLEPWVPRLTRHYFPDAAHWVHLEASDGVTAKLAEFFGS